MFVRIALRTIGLLIFLILANQIWSQTKYHVSLKDQFADYQIISVNSKEILEQINSQRSNEKISFRFLSWQLLLEDSGILTERYGAVGFDGKRKVELPAINTKALSGYTEQGGRVSITIGENFVQGFVRAGMFTYYFEPLYHFDKSAEKDLIVFYNTKDIKPGKEKKCGATEAHVTQNQSTRPVATGERLPGQCFRVEYAIASDFSMHSFYGSATAVQNHNIAVTNDMQTNYDDEFADGIQFEIVQQFIVTTSGGDPAVWTNTTNPSTLLTNFSNWGPTGFTAVHDLGSLWTRRTFDGTTVGIAWVGSVCTSSRYNTLMDFTSNASQKRVLLAHETGHNFSANHDSSNSGFIMAPSVNNSTTWSAASITAIQNHYLSRTCLDQCVFGPPQISFVTGSSSVLEEATSGSFGSCAETFKTILIPVAKNRSTTESISVNVSIVSGTTATNNRDFSLLSNSLTFPAGPAGTQNIQVRIVNDAIFESTENIVLQLSIAGGNAVTGTFNTHTLSIIDIDEVSLNCCSPGDLITYGNNNGSTNLIFWGEWDDARTRVLYLPSQLTAANITAGFITSLRFYVQSKGSTQPYQNFRVGMANVSETTLLNMPWVNTETVFTGSVTTVQGVWNEITFEKPFFWDGTSSLYFEFCFNNSSYTLNDLLRFTNPVGGGTGRYVEALIQDGSNGCILTSADANFVNYSNFSIQPHFQFRQLNAAKIETAVTATSNKSSLKSGETANFYSSNGRVYASVRNIGATDINCIEAAIETAGSSTPALPFGGGNYSAKTIKIDASYNAVYEVTLYYTQAELSAFGTNANQAQYHQDTKHAGDSYLSQQCDIQTG